MMFNTGSTLNIDTTISTATRRQNPNRKRWVNAIIVIRLRISVLIAKYTEMIPNFIYQHHRRAFSLSPSTIDVMSVDGLFLLRFWVLHRICYLLWLRDGITSVVRLFWNNTEAYSMRSKGADRSLSIYERLFYMPATRAPFQTLSDCNILWHLCECIQNYLSDVNDIPAAIQ